MQHGDALAQLAREIARVRRRLGWARALEAALAPVVAVAFWAALWLSGLPERLPLLAQSLAVIAGVVALIYAAWRAFRRTKRPDEREARMQLARDSRMDADTFETLSDLPAKLDASSIAFWRREQAQAAARASKAKAGPLRVNLQRPDPWRVRYAALLALAAGGVYAGAEAPERLGRAFLPDPGPLVGDGPIEVEAWLTPDPYTRASPISLSDRDGARIESPPSVEATVRVTGPRGAPHLVFDGKGGHRDVVFTRAADGAYEARLALPGAGQLKVVRFLTRAHWRVIPSADTAPHAQFTEVPKTNEKDEVTFGWSAGDDYGVRSMALRVEPVDPPPGLKGAAPIDTPIESPSGDPRDAHDSAELDLATHPYAGMDVTVRVVAFDALGQVGQSAPVRMTLPEKIFLQPLAQAAIEIRRMILWERRAYSPARAAPGGPATFDVYDPVFGTQRLVMSTDDQDPRLERAPTAIRNADRYIASLTMRPQDGYIRDGAVLLGFMYARNELQNAREIEDTNLAADTLWRNALRAEYGGAADARRALEMAQQALNDAMESGASPERLQQLMKALRQATQNYLQSLIQEAMRSGQQPQTQEDTEDQASMSQRDIDDLMRQVDQLMKEGRTAEAQALLQQLTNMLQNLDVRLTQGQQQGQQGEGGQQQQDEGLSQSMEELSDAIGEQRALNDDTRQQSQQGQEQGQQQGQGGQSLGDRQNDIREGLGQAQRRARERGVQSDSLQSAENAMRRAEDALRRGQFDDARAAQDEALAQMRQGAGELGAEMRKRGGGDDERNQTGERDPLGRETAGTGSGDGDAAIPSQSDRIRAREILDDIRRRAQDVNRPEAERDYLRRLLERFTGS